MQTTAGLRDQAAPYGSFNTERYVRGMERLVQAVQELSFARELEEVQRIVRKAARELTGCDGATFVLRDQDQCHYADEDAIAPLWKGKRFPLESCISGWTMLNKHAAVIPDIYLDERIPHAAYRPTFVKSLVMVPIRKTDPIGAIGNYWAVSHQASEEEVRLLQTLADATSVAMKNVRMYSELEHRVEERTEQLEQALVTDVLTGLYNRRGFYTVAERALQYATQRGAECLLLFIDVDGLKAINDRSGHDAGDAMIRDVAGVLRDVMRVSDLAARIGGDEFCVLALDPSDDELTLRDRLDARLALFNRQSQKPYRIAASVGMVRTKVTDDTSLDALITLADKRMYEDKRSKPSSRMPPPASTPVIGNDLHR